MLTTEHRIENNLKTAFNEAISGAYLDEIRSLLSLQEAVGKLFSIQDLELQQAIAQAQSLVTPVDIPHVLLVGPVRSGKTVIAETLAERFGYVIVRNKDEAKAAIAKGKKVVADSTNHSSYHRGQYLDLGGTWIAYQVSYPKNQRLSPLSPSSPEEQINCKLLWDNPVPEEGFEVVLCDCPDHLVVFLDACQRTAI